MEPALARPRPVAIDHDDPLRHDWRVTQRLTDDALSARVAGQARCADSGLDPDQWYPVSIEPARARREAAAAIAVCTGCPVRAQCLELSLRHWEVGKHGVWGGLVATERAQLRHQRRWAWCRGGDAR